MTLLGDGSISVHLDNVPIKVLLQELARHGVALSRVSSETTHAVPEPVPLERGDSAAAGPESDEALRLLAALQAGTEVEQYDALVRAVETARDVPAELLRQLYETGLSDSVRPLGFTTYLDFATDGPESVRQALVGGTANPSPSVRAEARVRLADFERYEKMMSSPPIQAEP